MGGDMGATHPLLRPGGEDFDERPGTPNIVISSDPGSESKTKAGTAIDSDSSDEAWEEYGGTMFRLSKGVN